MARKAAAVTFEQVAIVTTSAVTALEEDTVVVRAHQAGFRISTRDVVGLAESRGARPSVEALAEA